MEQTPNNPHGKTLAPDELRTLRRNLVYLSGKAGGYYQLANEDETIGKDISGVILTGCGKVKAKKIMNHLGMLDLTTVDMVPYNETVKLPHMKEPAWKKYQNKNGTEKKASNGNGHSPQKIGPGVFTKFVPEDGALEKITIEYKGAKFTVTPTSLPAFLKAIKENE